MQTSTWTAQSKIRILAVLMVLFLFLGTPVLADQPSEWSTAYADSHGKVNCLITTDEGEFVFAGAVNGYFLLAKADSEGKIAWWKTYQTGEATCVIQTSDGGYALGGSGEANFIKTDSAGNIQWSKNYMYENATETATFQVMSMAQTRDGGYILAGKTPAGYLLLWDWTVKTDAQGNIVWDKTYGTHRGNSLANAIIEADDGYVLAANSKLYKLDTEGNVQWSQPAIGFNARIVKCSDGGYLLCNDVTLTKTDAEGKTQWSKSYGIEGAQGCTLHCAIQTGDGGFVACGWAYPEWEGVGWIVKVDSAGNQVWSITAQPFTDHNLMLTSVVEGGNGGYVFTGEVRGISDRNQNDIWFGRASSTIQRPAFESIPQTPTETPTAEPTQTSTATANPQNGYMNTALSIAIILAGAVAVAAGLWTYFKRHKRNTSQKISKQ